ncbi:hypothetical protein PoHVEF18_006363 [Penicillium ochrochloron]
MVALSVVQSSNAAISKELPPGLVGVFVGATSGIGKATLLQLAKYARQPRLYFVGRSQSAADEILPQLNQINADGRYEFIKADASLLSVVDEVCRSIRQKETKIDILFQSQGTLDISTETSLFIRHAVLLREEAAPEAFASHRTAEEPDRPLHDDSANGFAHLVEALPEGSLGDELGGVGLLGPIDIHLAIESNDQPFVDAVLDRAEEEEGPLPSALCALLAAARNNQEEMCQFLVERGALDEYDLDGPGDAQMPHILDAAITTGNDTLLKQIMDTRGYHPMESPDWAITPGGDTILEMVAEKGSTDLFQKTVSWGGIIKPNNSACTRALLRATSKGKIEIVSHFLKHGFDVNGTYHTKAMEYGQNSDDNSDDYDPYEDQDLYRDITLLLFHGIVSMRNRRHQQWRSFCSIEAPKWTQLDQEAELLWPRLPGKVVTSQ